MTYIHYIQYKAQRVIRKPLFIISVQNQPTHIYTRTLKTELNSRASLLVCRFFKKKVSKSSEKISAAGRKVLEMSDCPVYLQRRPCASLEGRPHIPYPSVITRFGLSIKFAQIASQSDEPSNPESGVVISPPTLQTTKTIIHPIISCPTARMTLHPPTWPTLERHPTFLGS